MAVFVIDVGGAQYRLDLEAVSVRAARKLERAIGRSFVDWSTTLASGQTDLDVLIAMVWLARYQSGETGLEFDDVDFPLQSLSVSIEGDDKETSDDVDPTRAALRRPAGESSRANRGKANASATSRTSRTSSASVRGNGTA